MAGYAGWQDVLRHTDIDTAHLIVQLQLEDSYELARTFEGVTDAVLAEQLHRQELTQLQADLSSRQRGEDLEEDENDLEQALEGAAFGWSLRQWEDRVELVAEPPRFVTCTACTERTHPNDIIKVPCGHDYCRNCLKQLYYGCMTDETLFPPRCCHQEFPYELVKHHLSQRCRSNFGQKRVELETKDRTYCHVPTCSAFIKPEEYGPGRLAQCNRCSSWTCAQCKGPYHFDPSCPTDETTEALMRVAARNEWQRCFGCRRIVELKHGCNHITCVCKTEFCYRCGMAWKTCPCDQWDEERLVEQAEAIVDLERVDGEETPGEREARIQGAIDHLRAYHECGHERFKGIREEGAEYRCEVCSETYFTWIYQCRQCMMVACNTCRRHRL